MTRLLPLLALLSTLFLLGGCDDSCQFANDGACDEPLLCASGTDTSDCGGGATGGCNDTCTYAFDGECDDGGVGSVTDLCVLGTDCSDCGVR